MIPKWTVESKAYWKMGLPPVSCTVNHSIYMVSLLGPSFFLHWHSILCEIQGHSSMWACSHSTKYSQISDGISYTCLAFPSKQHYRAQWPGTSTVLSPTGDSPHGEEGRLESAGSILASSVPFLLSDIENNSRICKPRDAIFHVLTSLI